MTGSAENLAYRAGAFVAVVASLLTVWTTIVRDDGTGMSYFMLVMAAIVGAVSAGFGPAGMARAMVGVAIMQMLLGTATATGPVTASTPDGPLKALLFGGIFAALWLISAMFFRAASRTASKAPALR
ncbi:hypothetical protein KK137_00480 [Croceibacterium sp. LX-88]|uniref:Uncharacterized protein n=1 Tax=Croceibacterium selenioxidans TaxID=2838833 RepID=A0ABS5W0P1_9SPHN|nr:hypothetical protein [Croceibacterium selenioxidans]MBT2132795.1 hypothetical protein [Croceibacterium selenioxidans]